MNKLSLAKTHEVSLEIERIKKHMEEQMRKERVEATRTSEHQLQSVMSELCSLKDKHEKDTKERKVEEKTLLENIKASGQSQNTIQIASTQVAIKGIIQHSTRSSTVQLRVAQQSRAVGR